MVLRSLSFFFSCRWCAVDARKSTAQDLKSERFRDGKPMYMWRVESSRPEPMVCSCLGCSAIDTWMHACVSLRQDLKPKDIVTRKSFENAIVTVMALGGSTNAVLHLLAMARAFDIELSIDDFQTVSRFTSVGSCSATCCLYVVSPKRKWLFVVWMNGMVVGRRGIHAGRSGCVLFSLSFRTSIML